MKLDTLDGLNDNELQSVIARSEELLKQRDEERKDKAMAQARSILAAVGLSLSDIAAKGRGAKHGKPPAYSGGHRYQHPHRKDLVWNAKGQKPTWLRELEAQGGKPVEIQSDAENDNAPAALKKPM
jgi:DNA-binding protein H-NS